MITKVLSSGLPGYRVQANPLWLTPWKKIYIKPVFPLNVIDCVENIRRVGEIATLIIWAGIMILTAFISPFKSDRNDVWKRMPPGDFLEIYCQSTNETCEQRDVKGLYKKPGQAISLFYWHWFSVRSAGEAWTRCQHSQTNSGWKYSKCVKPV